jgi:hypothetical protein
LEFRGSTETVLQTHPSKAKTSTVGCKTEDVAASSGNRQISFLVEPIQGICKEQTLDRFGSVCTLTIEIYSTNWPAKYKLVPARSNVYRAAV